MDTGVAPHGASYFTRTAKITTVQKDGKVLSFFSKVTQGENVLSIMWTEYVAMKMIHERVPDFAPQLIVWGTYRSEPNIHFFMCAFHAMSDDELPQPYELATKFGELHAPGTSPNGNIIGGVMGEEFFTKIIIPMFEEEDAVQGLDPEDTELEQAILTNVIPRLLRPLETGGNSFEPCLLHGDAWDGNCGLNLKTGKPLIFDAWGIFSHNEYDLAPWIPTRYYLGSGAYLEAYRRIVGPCEPVADFDDRLLLYLVRFNMISSASYTGNSRWRHEVVRQMRILVEKFPDGYQGTEVMKGEQLQAEPGVKEPLRDSARDSVLD